MAMEASVLEALLRDAFPTADITVNGADGVHMGAEVIAEEFKGKNRVAQQRMVYAALKGKMDGSNGELHALALTTKAKE
jgi:acid stress-induced BolA-like protein IbaG/YrbA